MDKRRRRPKIEIPEDMFLAGIQKVPEHITIKYNKLEDIDIGKIDETIKHKFGMKKEKLKEIKEEICELKKKLEKSKGKEKENLLSSISELEEDRDGYQEGKLMAKYISDTEEYLKENNVAKYLKKAKRYITLELIKRLEDQGNICANCKFDMTDLAEYTEGKYVCPNCYCITNSMTSVVYDRDIDKYNMTGDDDTINFSQILDRFEGKLAPYPPESLYEELDEYFKASKLKITSEDVEKVEKIDGRAKGTSKRIMWMALEKTGNSQQYDNVNYIVYRYWGWDLPDIEKYRSKIMKDYKATQIVWNRIKPEYNRKASLGTQFRLYVHLKSAGFPCDREDFKIQEDISSLRLHNDAWRRMSEECDIHPIVQVGYV